MNLGILTAFFKNKKTKENIDFFKNRNKNFIIFFIMFFVAIFGVMFSLFIANKENIINPTKFIAEVPLEKEITSKEDIEKIRKISSKILGNSCSVQITKSFEYSNPNKKNVLLINFSENHFKVFGERYIDDKIAYLGKKLNQEFSDYINIEFKEEIIVSKVAIPNSYQIDPQTAIFITVSAIFIIFLFYIFAFKKIGGFFVALSLITTFLFSLAITTGVYFFVTDFLLGNFNDLLIWNSSIWFFVITTVACLVNYIFNSALIFGKIKNETIQKKELNIEIANLAINKNLKSLINNTKIITIVPTIAAFISKIIESILYKDLYIILASLPFMCIYILVGISCLLVSIYILVPFWMAFFDRKKSRKLKNKKMIKE